MRFGFQFSIRDCLFVTAIICLALGWWIDRQQLLGKIKVAQADLENSPWRYDGWRRTAISFAKAMREYGWYVKINADGQGYSYTTPDAFEYNPDLRRELNEANPLPSE